MISEATLPVRTRLHQLSEPPQDFIGRVLELEAHAHVLEQGHAHLTGWWGTSGAGKTALALKLAKQLTPRYPDAQIYIDLKGHTLQPLSAVEVLAHVIRAYHPIANLPDNRNELLEVYRSLLNGKRVMIVLDNAASTIQVEPLIPPGTCAMIVASRRPLNLATLPQTHLSALTSDDARTLLLKYVPHVDTHVDAIVERCGRLPLALQLAGGALSDPHEIDPAEYLHRLSEMHEQREHRNPLDATLRLGIELIEPDTQECWRALAIFPDTFDVDAAAAAWECDQHQAQHQLDTLLAHNLIETSTSAIADAAHQRYRLHDATRAFADEQLPAVDRVVARRRHAVYYQSITQEIEQRLKSGEALQSGLDLFDVEWDNIRSGQAWAAERASEEEQAAQLCSAYAGVGVYVLSMRQHPRELIRWLDVAVAAAKRLNDKPTEVMHLSNLGNAYWSLGKPRRAIGYYEQALELSHTLNDRRSEAAVLGSLGNAYWDLGQSRRAIELYEQWLNIAREIGDRRAEGAALGNLGVAYKNLGAPRRAIEYYEQDLAIAREAKDRRSEGYTLYNMSLAYKELGERSQALLHIENAMHIFEQIGDPNLDLLRTQWNEWHKRD